jgi:hypothetical protein
MINPNEKRKIPVIKPLNTGLGDNRIFNAIQLCITTRCNRLCKSCILRMSHDSGKDVDVEWIKDISKYFQGLRLLQVSGGEPTIHNDFHYITENIRQWFNPQMLMLITNGAKILKHINILGHYDHLRITYYNKKSYPGSTDNMNVIEEFKKKFKGSSIIWNKPSRHRINISDEKIYPCGLGANDLALVINKKIYPCCSASGVDVDSCIEITEEWKDELKKIKLPCDKGCPFALPKELFDAWQDGMYESNPVKYKKLLNKYERNEKNVHNKIKENGWDNLV